LLIVINEKIVLIKSVLNNLFTLLLKLNRMVSAHKPPGRNLNKINSFDPGKKYKLKIPDKGLSIKSNPSNKRTDNFMLTDNIAV
jgi:hypothetical protein